MVNNTNAQSWLEKKYPKEQRNTIKDLRISEKELKGSLDLSDFVNLEDLHCSLNQLVKITGLKEMKKLSTLYLWDVYNTDINETLTKLPNSLEKIYYPDQAKSISELTDIVPQLVEYEWRDIHADFRLAKRRNWEKRGFSKEQTNEWIKVGVEPKDANFTSYLRDIKKLTPQEFLNNKEKYWKDSDENKELRDNYNRYGWCCQCQQPNTSIDWCQSCQEQEWKKLSGQELIEKFVQQQQLREINEENKLEWIPHEQFTNIEYLAEGGFSKIYKAKFGFDNRDIILKSLNNSQNITLDFLTEINNTKLVDGSYDISVNNIVKCYGISQDPQTKNYLMVMDYVKDGNLREYLRSNARKLNWYKKLDKLLAIVNGLQKIHRQGLVHRDFHIGNILNDDDRGEYVTCFITDLGLSKPASSQKEAGEIFGVLPYVAPEVLRSQPYTKAADIYSFGMIMYEMFSGLPPYNLLALDILKGLRPQLQIKIPQLLEDLVNRCWDVDPQKRPSVEELWKDLNYRRSEVFAKFIRQVKEVEAYNQTLPEEVRYPHEMHEGAVGHSKAINTRQITELLTKTQTINLEDKLMSLNLDEFTIPEEIEDNQTDLENKVEVPPKENY